MAVVIEALASINLDDLDDEDIRSEAERRGYLRGDVESTALLDALTETDAPQWIIDGLNDWLAQPKPKSSLGVAFARHKRW